MMVITVTRYAIGFIFHTLYGRYLSRTVIRLLSGYAIISLDVEISLKRPDDISSESSMS